MEGLIQTPLAAGALALNGWMSADILDNSGTTPIQIIKTDTPWQVRVRWQLNGPFVETMAGSWHIHVLIEQMGGTVGGGHGLEVSRFFLPNVPFVATAGNLYNRVCGFDVAGMAAWAPPVPHEGGLYRVLVTLTFWNLDDTPGPLAGFVDPGIVQIFAP
jgi:hypothetical protein